MAQGGDHAQSWRNKKDNVDFSLNNLSDELLIEILRRLPTAKSVRSSCILVCKRWRSLTCSSYFISQFVEHHRNQNKNSYYPAYQNSPGVFVRPYVDPYVTFEPNVNIYNNELVFLVGGEDAVFKSPGFKLEFLPEKREFISVLASCDDLLLCLAATKDDYRAYYVCNPFTKNWFLLPSSTTLTRHSAFITNTCFGLVYDLKYYRRFDQEIHDNCRFRVVCIDDDKMLVYCSETEQWNETPLLGDYQEYTPRIRGNATLDGRLYWLNFRGKIVAHDPFTNEAKFFDVSDEYCRTYNNKTVTFCLGICQGTLRFMRLENNFNAADNEVACLSIWELKDYESRRLTLKQRIFLNTESSLIRKSGSMHFYCLAGLLSFHPTEEDVVYLELEGYVIRCKIQKEDLEMVFYERYYYYFSSKDAITTSLPWWPTPVSTLS